MSRDKVVQTDYVPVIEAEKITLLDNDENEDEDGGGFCCIFCWYLFIAVMVFLLFHFINGGF